ncbi:LamG-like jellyroll fold domain-containing protein [Paraglaciecola aquimarina]|uniref:LamG-like jellyroll fold domain-containing protein n=1 Tax=Paraglaciecola aquimarina TaxID=1235557 RepID=A0ABU3SUG6_9ALTE|nr:LamG-like jellyroll fold domain-containing protein [Paraglaciecola aquimarina]MDU0353653.1 LamG-like jellyroll fold domain-containing protein [Paraglaciecola aquimarina]
MISNIETHKRFSDLLGLLIEEKASPEQISELLELAKQNDEFKHILRNQLEMDNLISQALCSTNQAENFVEKVLAESANSHANTEFEKRVMEALPKDPKISTGKSSGTVAWIISGLSIAACMIISVLSFTQPSHHQTGTELSLASRAEIQDKGVAIVANAVGLDNPDHFVIGKSVAPGKLQIDDGFLELEFYHGAQLKIAGPAELEIVSAKRVKLFKGKVMTDVPTVAIGFTIDTPNSEVVDLGTAIGVQVDANGDSQVHVFEGLVEAISKAGVKKLIEKGDAVSFFSEDAKQWQDDQATASQFNEFSEIADLTYLATSQKQQDWLAVKEELLQDPALVAYYDFEKADNKPRLLKNRAANNHGTHGAIVGAKWGKGPWNGKGALEFKRPGDRVRIDITDKFKSFTLASWVKIDSLDRAYNSLLLTDGYKPGDIHWQIGNFHHNQIGTIILGLSSTELGAKDYKVEPFFSTAESGTWYHLATTVDQDSEQVKIFVNGSLFKTAPLTKKSEYWHIGKASIANWDNMNLGSPIRNLNGSMAELVILSRALGDDEINRIALNDAPHKNLSANIYSE